MERCSIIHIRYRKYFNKSKMVKIGENSIGEIEMSTLKSALATIIAKVEMLHDDTVFNMEYPKKCVLGKTKMWSSNVAGFVSIPKTVKELFGIDVADIFVNVLPPFDKKYGVDVTRLHYTLFNADHMELVDKPAYTPEQWNVIKLFTTHVTIDNYRNEISKKNWLSRAYIQMDKLA